MENAAAPLLVDPVIGRRTAFPGRQYQRASSMATAWKGAWKGRPTRESLLNHWVGEGLKHISLLCFLRARNASTQNTTHTKPSSVAGQSLMRR